MTSTGKLLAKIRSGSANVRLDDLVKLMESYGFTARRTGHGYLFLHDDLKGAMLPHVPIPLGREKKVLKPYVDMCLMAIDMLEKGENT
jgi:hypothetical protein